MTKYEMIFHKILSKIENQEIMPGDTLPSEHSLMEEYNASRDTVRKALNLLINNGYIQKNKGKKSIVLDTQRFKLPFSNIESFKEVAKSLNEDHIETKVISINEIYPDKKIMNALNINSDEKVWMIQRIRKLSHESVILDTDFILKSVVPLLNKEICEDSLYDYLENELNLEISYADKIITCQSTNGLDEKHLDMKGYNMVVNIESYVYLNNNQLFQYTISRHRPDKFRFEDRARRILKSR